MSGLRIAIVGPGRMGRAVAALAPERGDEVVATLGRAPAGRSPITREALRSADVAIEFTEPASAVENILAAVEAGVPIVVGTTGWLDRLPEVEERVRRSGGALLWAANFSLGVHLFAELAEHAAALLRNVAQFDVHLVETHHAAKRDAPSGTARMLAGRMRGPLGREVATTSIRTGSVPGTHEIVLDAPFEQMRLLHEARDRRVFAEGALAAARWLAGRRGVFTMRDVLVGGEGAASPRTPTEP